ncbi:MAG: PD-(D/E)XK nuclease family transposase [Candidatus Paracaedibacteraceae bacterium]|nr:PD-(D/E)XK nuclease family transposase [Candidatus Paracaedibacteraceae bacterium]
MTKYVFIRLLSIVGTLNCLTLSYAAEKRAFPDDDRPDPLRRRIEAAATSNSGREAEAEEFRTDRSSRRYLSAATGVESRGLETASHLESHPQVYGIPTYDALFKYVLSDDEVRSSFFKAFIPGIGVVKSERLDDHMHPVQSLQTLRTFLHREETEKTVDKLSGATGAKVILPQAGDCAAPIEDAESTAFLHEIVGRFDEIKAAFPKMRYDGTMDFVCQLSTGGYAMVEMQVIPQNYWDNRALAYAAAFYGNQLFKGDEWKNIRRVIGINILGGGRDDLVHWTDTPSQFMRHYKFQEQLHAPARYIDGIELIQYSIMNARGVALEEKEMHDWITFFRNAHHMSEDAVREQITTPAVLRAFELSKIHTLPAVVLASYEAQDKDYERYSHHNGP